MRESYKNGFAFHKMEVEQDLELKKYVLKESYLND
jgi:hypothetical protein